MKGDFKTITAMISLAILASSLLVMTGCSSEQGDDLHDHSVEIEGKEMKLLTVREVAELWEIDPELLLSKMITEFGLQKNYTVDTVLEEIRVEYPFSPALVKDLAEEIKTGSVEDE